ncbi:MAG: Gfo/Idh/MocA family oxidoreductase [Candidatus Limnocylindria bacterium]
MIGVGAIGVGLMGRRHAENVARVGGAKLVAVHDANKSLMERVAGELGAKACGSVDQLLSQQGVNAVVIASPARAHEAHAVAALAAGKDALLEKPIADTLDAADRILSAAAASPARLQIGFMRRYDPAYAEAASVVRSGKLGEVRFLKGVGRDRDAPSGAAGSLPRSNIFTESAIHDFDVARWITGDEVAGVRATAMTLAPDAPGPDLALADLRFVGGAAANVETYRGARYAYDIRAEIVCSEGTICVGGFAQGSLEVLLPGGGRRDLLPGFLERFADAYLLELRDFLGGVEERRPPRVSGDDGRRALAIALACDRACDDHREVVPE